MARGRQLALRRPVLATKTAAAAKTAAVLVDPQPQVCQGAQSAENIGLRERQRRRREAQEQRRQQRPQRGVAGGGGIRRLAAAGAAAARGGPRVQRAQHGEGRGRREQRRARLQGAREGGHPLGACEHWSAAAQAARWLGL